MKKLMQLLVAGGVVAGSVLGGTAGAQAAPVYHGGVYVQKYECEAELQQAKRDRSIRVIRDCYFSQPSDSMVEGYTYDYTPAY